MHRNAPTSGDTNRQAVTGVRHYALPSPNFLRPPLFLADPHGAYPSGGRCAACASILKPGSKCTTRSSVCRVRPNQSAREPQVIAIMSYGYVPDEENGLGAALFDKSGPSIEFAEQEVRLGFIRKVFGLLSVQLAITTAVTAAFLFSPGVKSYVNANQWTFWTAFGASLILVLVLSCWEQARRQHPLNLIILFLFTACESVLVATISSFYDTDIVLMAAALTVGVTACLSLYALQTKRDFTAAGGILFSLLFAMIGAGILTIFIHSKVLNIAIAGIGAAVFACYIVFDVQLMVGTGSYSISPDDYVFATINIYLDVINLFLYLLRLLQEIQGNN